MAGHGRVNSPFLLFWSLQIRRYADICQRLHFAFPKELEARSNDYPLLFGTFYPSIKEEKHLKEYLASDRRLPYSMGVFRHYPELDRQ